MDDHDVWFRQYAVRLIWRGLVARQVAGQQQGCGRAHHVDGDVPGAVLPAQSARVCSLLVQSPHATFRRFSTALLSMQSTLWWL